MLHLPLFENRIAQFAAKFAALPDGNWAFHRNDWEEGWLVRRDELQGLLDRHAAIVLRARTVSRWWIGIALVLIAVLVIGTRGHVDSWWGGAIMLVPVPWILWELHRADRLPLEANRMAVAPPRGLRAGARARMAAFPLTLPLLMIGIGGLLLIQLWRGDGLASDPVGTGVGLFMVAFGSFILTRKS